MRSRHRAEDCLQRAMGASARSRYPMSPVYTLDEAGARLHKSRRWLQDWLGDHPADRFGNPFFAQLGRTKVFTDDDLNRILAACKEDQRCRNSPPRSGRG